MNTIQHSLKHHSEQGVVSIFIVIFAAMFMTIITASFVTIMITDQHQATSMDLSQTAYDSAMSGVEDAKRALVFCQTAPSNVGCQEIKNDPPSTSGNDCTLLGKVGISGFVPGQGGNQEVPIQGTEGANSLDQAYTCVGISAESPNVQTTVGNGQVNLIPLSGGTSFNTVTVAWNTASSSSQANIPSNSTFSSFANWTATKNYPPVLQTTLITVSPPPIDQTKFDQAPSAGGTGAATLMLHPQTIGTALKFSADSRGASTTPQSVQCNAAVSGLTPAGNYTCKATIDLGFALNPNQQAYLAIQPIYQGADINVALQNNGSPVNFSNVQAVVDSTGRANDIFRRVSARVNLVPLTGTYPNAALNLSGSLCKDFTLPQTLPNIYKSNDSTCQ